MPDETQNKASLLQKAIWPLDDGDKEQEVRDGLMGETEEDMARYVKWVSAARPPEICKTPRSIANIAERTPITILTSSRLS